MPASKTSKKRVMDARPDTLDFRDRMYTASLYEVPTSIDLETYKQLKVPILDQGQEGACTGFGLATVANYLLHKRKEWPDLTCVSARMLYEMARRYDEWPGEDYSGSSARGAMKGWNKHGICSDERWLYNPEDADKKLTEERTSDALKRPLGAYYRVNHQDIIAMHSAMAEVGILYVTSAVHQGWNEVKSDGIIAYNETKIGGHAFAIVAYNQQGFWIQNSWGKDWGKEGFALLSYDDWLENGDDAWVARLGAPIELYKTKSSSISYLSKSAAYIFSDLRPHIISVGNEGQLSVGGNFGTSLSDVQSIFRNDFKRITEKWTKKRLLLYAHGGLVSENAAVQRLSEYRTELLKAEVYPISFIWHSDAWSTITNILQDTFNRRRPEGFLDGTKDFMLDRLDDALEPVARSLTGKLQWEEMKENAMKATTSKTGAARITLELIAELLNEFKDLEIHIVGHSAGSIFHAPLIELITKKGKITTGRLKGENGYGFKIKTCTMWAPACTIDLFKEHYLAPIKEGAIEKFTLFSLTDQAERDDNCAHIYNKSLLYLVSNSFESKPRIPLFRDGIPILGMQKFINQDKELSKLFSAKKADWILSPNSKEEGALDASRSNSHGGFDDDKATVKATFGRILDHQAYSKELEFQSSASAMEDRRNQLTQRKTR